MRLTLALLAAMSFGALVGAHGTGGQNCGTIDGKPIDCAVISKTIDANEYLPEPRDVAPKVMQGTPTGPVLTGDPTFLICEDRTRFLLRDGNGVGHCLRLP